MTLQEVLSLREGARAGATKCAFARNAPSRGLPETLRGIDVAEVGQLLLPSEI
jgi:hypothetical protein